MIKLKHVMVGLWVLVCLLFVAPLYTAAKTTCNATPQGERCVSEVPIEKFAPVYATQRMSQWCWAASISMIFRYYGHPVDQGRIVETAYGRRVNLPSGNGINMSVQMNRDWTDDNGKRFSARITSAYDAMAGFNNMTNGWIVDQLHAERPLVVGSGTHAMVATAVEYFKTPQGPFIINVGVFDPWPGAGIRGLVGCDIVPVGNICQPAPMGPFGPMGPPVMGRFIYAASTAITN
jgi:hypothetical protein